MQRSVKGGEGVLCNGRGSMEVGVLCNDGDSMREGVQCNDRSSMGEGVLCNGEGSMVERVLCNDGGSMGEGSYVMMGFSMGDRSCVMMEEGVLCNGRAKLNGGARKCSPRVQSILKLALSVMGKDQLEGDHRKNK